ncbi:unnamed protein product [Allacma fusca]|uniref:Glutamine amidotransferase type-2 domain-containing protein n=1 Tax=Allacma fusca TaxID=39272 RepID=A0A8J2PHV9_9HEXA|nr:unnamed protein product [Allacma fusca]
MCGIFCNILRCRSHNSFEESQVTHGRMLEGSSRTIQLLKSRGPDAEHDAFVTSTNFLIKLSSYVLWTQGLTIREQPIVTEKRIFAFNGDIYSLKCSPLPANVNDGLFLFECMESSCESVSAFLNLISGLQGPFAFILVDRAENLLWFGRDYFGRSSLLFGLEKESFFISSVAPFSEEGNVFEVPSAGVFCLDLSVFHLKLYPWECLERRVHVRECTENFKRFLKCKLDLETEMKESITPSICSRLKSIDLQCSILKSLEELASSKASDNLLILRAKNVLEEPVARFIKTMRRAVKLRVDMKPPFCKNCLRAKISEPLNCSHSKVSVLFSGGLDSTVIAYLVCELLPPGESLDLINVAFATDNNSNFKVPDRQTGLESFKVLKEIFQPRGITLNFVEANVTKSEVQEVREDIVVDLVSPLRSVLDDSIGCCLWFAARGKGNIQNENEISQSYTSPARIIFVGSGADELLGGYSRHRSAFENKGWQGLVDEMQEDIDRISMRNLGRDNRVITNHGVCPRMPFLDENVVNFLTQECQVWTKCFPIFPRGLGEKILLRAVAAELFGMDNVKLALFPKRAMQFGSRIAKLENSKEKGGDVCVRLQATSKSQETSDS